VSILASAYRRWRCQSHEILLSHFVLHVQLMDEFAAQECAVITVTPQRKKTNREDVVALAGMLQSAMRV